MSTHLRLDDRLLPRVGPVLLAFAAALPLVSNVYVVHVGVLILVYLTLAMGLSIVVGLAGLLNLGYVAFYAVGAYGYAILNTVFGVGFWPSLLVGSLSACVIGILLGLPTLRASGDYFALVTLGLGEIVRIVLLNGDPVTNGPRGIMGIQAPTVHGSSIASPSGYYWLALVLAAFTTTITYRIRFSRAGLTLLAIRDNEKATAALGHNPFLWKLFAFAVGAAIAGAAGVFFAAWQRFVSPNSFTLLESVLVLSIVVLAGYGHVLRIVAAGVFLVVLPEVLRGFAEARLLVYGAVLIGVVVVQEKRRQRARLSLASASTPVHGSQSAEVSPLSADVSGRLGSRPRASAKAAQVLVVDSILKRFGGIVALNGVSFTASEGELIAIIGPNGAGKTTLFNCLAGALRPDGGTGYIRVAGHAERIPPQPWRAARLGIARTFQEAGSFSSLSPTENVVLGIPESGFRVACRVLITNLDGERRRLDHSALRLLERVGVDETARPVGHLPLVLQKRIGIAQALALRPALLLLDEPAAGMTPAERQDLLHVLLRLRDETGITILLVEHDPQFVMAIADRVLVLDRGELIAAGTPAVVRRDPRVRSVYLGETDETACFA